MTLETEVLAKVADQLNSIEGLPCEISLKELSLDAPALFLHQTGGEIVNRTVGGSYDKVVRFELVYRTPAVSEAQVITAQGLLDTLICEQLETWTRTRQLPDLGDNREALAYEVGGLSSVIRAEDNGQVVYAITFGFTFHQKAVFTIM